MTVKLYSKPGCGPCIATKRAFEARGIPFEEIDLSKDAEALRFVMEDLGYRAPPVVYVGPDDHWGGEFRADRIGDLAAQMQTEGGEE